MTWAVISKELREPVHSSGSFEGAERWANKHFMVTRAEFQHTSPILAPADAVILFRMFLKETNYRQGKVRAKWVADAFNDWLKKKHPDTKPVSTQRMYRILKAWGADVKRDRRGGFEYYLNRRHVCDHCGGRKHREETESTCSFCHRTEVFE